MPCYSPLRGFRAKEVNSSGKRGIVFNPVHGFGDLPVEVPCGQCIGCRIARSKAWALRCVHEAQLHEENCFITLTYDDEHLPPDGGLKIKHFQDFMKRLRFSLKDKQIRFFHCGEYGSKNFRPHYHAIIFGHDFPDKELWKVQNGYEVHISNELGRLWPYGFSTVAQCTFETAAYVARYIMKKITGEQADEHYQVVNRETGELHQVQPEYVTMSRRPGIAFEWYATYKADLYPKDFITHDTKKFPVPKYYDRCLEREDMEQIQELKAKRVKAAKKRSSDNTPERLKVREECKRQQLNKLKREL